MEYSWEDTKGSSIALYLAVVLSAAFNKLDLQIFCQNNAESIWLSKGCILSLLSPSDSTNQLEGCLLFIWCLVKLKFRWRFWEATGRMKGVRRKELQGAHTEAWTRNKQTIDDNDGWKTVSSGVPSILGDAGKNF